MSVRELAAEALILKKLHSEFPEFRFWRESHRGQPRWVARRAARGPGLYIMMTADLDELRQALRPDPPRAPAAPAAEPEGT